MSIPIEAGDVIITHEVIRSKLGQISKQRLDSDMIYNLPYGFTDAAVKALENLPEDVPLFAVSQTGTLQGEAGISYNLHDSADTARKGFQMQWYVAEADNDNDQYSLVAIGSSRSSRIQDWEKAQQFLPSNEIPDVTEYLYLKNVDSTFFEKKAVFRLTSSGIMEPLN